MRLIDFVYHSTLGLLVIKKKKKVGDLVVGVDSHSSFKTQSKVIAQLSLYRSCSVAAEPLHR